ncbi:PAS domain S-box protein [Sphingomonas morindae]|uniref:histidine kinase n=1 Tax=Sphingomonas morindae TaxID=1541170 RepID=A0ABY4X3H1_9SPHN|nr:PAS domain S-box protein [Sphingomonas morindae]USI71435.1 PAS domain S-box protein [Sphingomonas morindae]
MADEDERGWRPHGGGAMGAVLRAHRWAETPLGPLADWSPLQRAVTQSLLLSPVASVALWGPRGIAVYNQGYADVCGPRHPAALGRSVLESWPEAEPFNRHVLDSVLAGETLSYREQPLILYRHGEAEQVWMDLSYSPLLDESGRAAGVLALVVDSTQRVLTADRIREREQRQAFLLELSDRLRERGLNGREMLATATAAVAQRLDVACVGYAELEPELGQARILHAHVARGPLASLPGDRVALDDLLDPTRRAALDLGRIVRIEDAAADTAAMACRLPLASLGVRALLAAPICRDGRTTAMLFIGHDRPRPWRTADADLALEVADRTWAAYERARAETRQQRSEQALKRREEQLRLAIAAADIGLWDVDRVSDTLFWDARVRAMFGVEPEAPVTLDTFYAGLHPEDREATTLAFAAAFDPARRAVYDVEYRTVDPRDGRIRWVAAKGRGLFDAEGRCVRVLGTTIDITARKATEARLRELNATLERRVAERTAERDRVWRNSRDLLVVIGADGIFRAVNPAWTALLGHAPEEVIGRSFLAFLAEEDAERTIAGLARAVADHDLTAFENRFRHKQGGLRWISWHTSREGDLVYAYGRDITEEKAREAALRDAEEALRQSQKMEAIGQLTGGVAHDFNNLLTPILGSLDMLSRRGLDDARMQRLIDGALQSAERASTLVHRLLAFARRQPLQPQPVDLSALVAGMAELITRTSGPQIRITVDAPAGLPRAHADANQLEMALLNLAVNARDAMPEGGALGIEVRVATDRPAELAPGRYILLALTDTGIGMDAETLARAVEPFFSTKGLGRGTGLGLSMVHGLARQLGGTLRLASTPGVGTRAELWLPVDERAPRLAEPHAGNGAATEQAGLALLVDDEAIVRATTAEMLIDLGYRVVEADSAERALALLDKGLDPDLLVSDHLMPGMSGSELARAARGPRPTLPVLIISGYADLEKLAPDLPHLAKPFRRDELARALLLTLAGTATPPTC